MILKRYYLGCLAQASYLIGDQGTGTAAIVDPRRDIDEYLADCRQLGLEIRHVILTHFHADFIAGHIELRNRCGATLYLGAGAEAAYAFTPLAGGDVIEYGGVRLEALETPGHTPEGISILVFDLEKDDQAPHAVLTGDTLFIGDVGRPDLLASIGLSAEELARSLYRSLHERLLTLPDETLLYPGHGAGSMCGRNPSSETVSTIGDQRRFNDALQPMTEEAFVRVVTAGQPEAPPYFLYDAALNRQERQTLEEALATGLRPLAPDELLRLRNAGAQIVDTRDTVEYAGGHLDGSLNISLSGSYAAWAGTLVARERPIAIIAEPAREHEAALRLARIGYDHVAGYLAGGMPALAGRGDLVRETVLLAAPELAGRLARAEPPRVLDVRSTGERAAGHIAGSLHIPLNQLPRRLAEVPGEGSLVLYCRTDTRSATAASILEQSGRRGMACLAGGIAAWEAARLPMVSGSGEPATAG